MPNEFYNEPLLDRVIINPDPVADKTEGGIIIADSYKERPRRGVVIDIGPGLPNDPTTVKKGERVLFSKNAGVEIEDEPGFLMMREADIIAKIKTGKRPPLPTE